MQLRDYQENAVRETLESLSRAENPCLMLPTGAGKSVVLADLCHKLVDNGARILMLTHVKELVEQNARRLHDHWLSLSGTPAPLGVYSAGLGRKELGRQITYAGVQSFAGVLSRAGSFDAAFVDECHLIPTKGEGRYRKVFDALPNIARIGLTATPWRLGHGSLIEGDGISFSHLLQPEGTSVRELVAAGHLAPLRSKHTETRLLELVGGVGRRGGEYIESELANAVNQAHPNELIAREIYERGNDAQRRHWLVFCVSIDHANEMARLLTELGAPAAVVHAKMSHLERTEVLARFRNGQLRAVCNVNILTTGFDFPDLDMLAFCRPTLSPVLYVQMGGRGMRLKSHTDHCLVLDFAGLVATHGPITDVNPPKAKGQSGGEAPVKVCPACSEIVLISCMVCPSCGFDFPRPAEHKKPKLHNDDIMAEVSKDGLAKVESWQWSVSTTRKGDKTIRVDYHFSAPTKLEGKTHLRAAEFLNIWHPEPTGGWAVKRAAKLVRDEKLRAAVLVRDRIRFDLMAELSRQEPPTTVQLAMKDGWVNVTRHQFPKPPAGART